MQPAGALSGRRGGTSIATELSGIDYAGGSAVVGDTELEGPSEFYLVSGDDLVPIASSDHLMILTISTDGELVVLLERSSDDMRRSIAWDVDSRSEVASIDIPTDCDDRYEFRVVGIDLDHRVFLTVQREALMWVPGEDPIPITGVDPADLGAKPWPGGLARERTRGDGGIATSLGDAFGTVDDRGRYREAGTITSSDSGPGRRMAMCSFPTQVPGGTELQAWSTPTIVRRTRSTCLDRGSGCPSPGSPRPSSFWRSGENRPILTSRRPPGARAM